MFKGGVTVLPIERRNRIKALLKEREHMKIAELSEILDVSEMTIHRDLKPLIDEGFVMKTFGGVALVKETTEEHIPDNTCVICRRLISERLAYRIILKNNKIEMACCSHCGLIRHQQLGDEVMQALTHDFLKQTTINAVSAWYVMDTSLVAACCQPQVLSFESKEDADKFVKGFGGQVYSFNEAIPALDEKMKGGGCCHH